MTKQRKIIGHRKQLNALAKSINSDKIFPVWIFCGPNGIGKTSIAYKFAKCLLSDAESVNENLDLPDEHKIHNLVENKIHPDFFSMDNASPSIDDVRNLMDKIKKTPTLSKRRVIIIENAENFNKNVSNSLLKILEEPPKDTIFILICSTFGNLPITLLSRAFKLRFSPLTENEVELALKLSEVENAKELSEIAEGSIGDALYLYENNGMELYENILDALSSDYENSNKVVKYIIENNLCSNFKLIKNLIIKGLKDYIDTITEFKIHKNFEKFIGKVSIDHESEKILRIISNLNKEEILLLDKNAIIAEVFETFFERN